MATSVLSSTFNAFAFAGAGWIFSKINHGDYAAEMKRHNLAMEKLSRDRDLWTEARDNELDRLANLRYEKTEGFKDIVATNKDLDAYKRIQDARVQIEQKFEKTRPELENYYKPSQEMTRYVERCKSGYGCVWYSTRWVGCLDVSYLNVFKLISTSDINFFKDIRLNVLFIHKFVCNNACDGDG